MLQPCQLKSGIPLKSVNLFYFIRFRIQWTIFDMQPPKCVEINVVSSAVYKTPFVSV